MEDVGVGPDMSGGHCPTRRSVVGISSLSTETPAGKTLVGKVRPHFPLEGDHQRFGGGSPMRAGISSGFFTAIAQVPEQSWTEF